MKATKLLVALLLMLGTGQRLAAQGIVYFDPPDIGVSSIYPNQSTATVDTDQDGGTDFVFSYDGRWNVVPQAGSAVWILTGQSQPPSRNDGAAPAGTIIGDPLPSGQAWRTGSQITLMTITQGAFGGPFGLNSGYMPFRLTKPDGYHYGWIGLRPGGLLFFVSDWAYNTVPNQPLAAGVVPEPSTWALLGVGALCLWRLRQRSP